MFDNKSISEQLADVNLEDSAGIEETTFEQFDFVVVGGEDAVIFHHGRKEDFSDPIDFYLKSHYRCVEFLMEESIGKDEFYKNYLSKSVYSSISEDDFLRSARGYFKGLNEEFTIELNGQWVEGVRVFNEIDEFHAVAVTDLEYYSFFWMTTG